MKFLLSVCKTARQREAEYSYSHILAYLLRAPVNASRCTDRRLAEPPEIDWIFWGTGIPSTQ
jgi:hypothetical protein